jgi:hypothetical protein
MSEAPEKLIPAQRDDLIGTLAFALTRDSRLARMQSAELLDSIVAERIVDRLRLRRDARIASARRCYGRTGTQSLIASLDSGTSHCKARGAEVRTCPA